jgi:hypothetical protein
MMNKRIEVTGTPNRTISHEEFASAIGGEFVRPITRDGIEIVPGLEVWFWDDDAQDVISAKIETPGPKMSKFDKPTSSGYVGVRNKSCWSTREAAITGHKADQDELERRFPNR